MNTNLDGKKVLLFAPAFFNYYRAIKEEIELQGAEVDVILEDFVNKSLMYRFLYIKNERLKYAYTEKYYIHELNRKKDSYDVVLVIRGEAISEKVMKELREKNSEAKFIMYQWDSIKNNPNALKLEKYFDLIYTFDFDDAKEKKWKYRPLFFIESNYEKGEQFDFAFVGTLYYRRATLLNKLKEYCEKNDFSEWDYLYSPRVVYILHKYILKDKRYTSISKKDVKFSSLSTNNLNKKYDNARILVDYTADDQSGLTMRTIESIGHGCKLITNNKRIRETNLYRWGNIYIYDLDNFNIPRSFVESDYTEMDPKSKNYYSLKGWVEEIFESLTPVRNNQ